MDLSTSLYITQKGEDELKHRVYKLGMKKRSVLILLDKPKSFECLLAKLIFPQNEIVEEIEALIQDRFISLSGDALSRSSASALVRSAVAPAPRGTFHLDDEIILSEAKFMLNDFSVDSFGTRSQVFVDAIRACKSVKDLELCLSGIFAATEKKCPNRLPVLVGLVAQINETA